MILSLKFEIQDIKKIQDCCHMYKIHNDNRVHDCRNILDNLNTRTGWQLWVYVL